MDYGAAGLHLGVKWRVKFGRNWANMTVMKRFVAVFAAFLLLVLAGPRAAQSPRDRLLVTPAWLAAHLSDPDLVILHVGDKADYAARHIRRRAIRRAGRSVRQRRRRRRPQSRDAPRRDAARSAGRRSAFPIARASSSTTPRRRSRRPRASMLTLDYAGLGDRSSLLDGGMGAWDREGHDVTGDVPAPRTGLLAPLTIKPIIVDAAFVKANLTTAEHLDRGRAADAVLRGHAGGRIGPGAAQDRAHRRREERAVVRSDDRSADVPARLRNCRIGLRRPASSPATRSWPIAIWASRRPPRFLRRGRSATRCCSMMGRSRTGPSSRTRRWPRLSRRIDRRPRCAGP